MVRRHHLNILLASQTQYDLGQICHFLLTNWLLFLICLYLKSMQLAASRPFQNVVSILIFFHTQEVDTLHEEFLIHPVLSCPWMLSSEDHCCCLSFHLFSSGCKGRTELAKFTLLFMINQLSTSSDALPGLCYTMIGATGS